MKTHVTETILSRVQSRFAKFPASARSFDSRAFGALERDVIFTLQVGNLLTFCEKDTIYGLFHIDRFIDLPADARRINATLRDNMLSAVRSVYLTAAQRIKNQYKKGKLTPKEETDITGGFDREGSEIPGLAHHILGVFTSLLQMYYATHTEPSRLDPARLQVGSANVAQELATIFRQLHPDVDNENTFRKWAFISLFHDIAKIEENFCTLKHDVLSARFLKNQGIFDMLSLSESEKDEAELIIGKHVEIGCHGPGDHSIASLKHIFLEDWVSKLFTHKGGNINPEKLDRFLDNALLMWTHDSAGTTRRGLATSLPFDYLTQVFEGVLELARSKNLARDMVAIDKELEECARRFHKERMGRIVCAWLYSESAKDKECTEQFVKAMERVRGKTLSKFDCKTFEEYFPLASGKNHLFNMLVLPIRKRLQEGARDPEELAEAYDAVVKGFVLLTKALKQVGCDEMRAVNDEGRMELNEARRAQMAQRLSAVVSEASDVKKDERSHTVAFVNKKQATIRCGVKMRMGKDEEKRDVLFVSIARES